MKFNTENKTFRGDLEIMFNALLSGENFAFSKFADGELAILKGNNIDLTQKCNGEFKYNQNEKLDEIFRDRLMQSLKLQDPRYFVGIGCPCCIGNEDFQLMKNMTDQQFQNYERMTWANLFVNNNYPYYVENFIPLFHEKKVILVCNEKANISQLFPNLVKDFRIGTNAWIENFHIIYEIKKYIKENNITNHIFLFAAGPLGNLLTYYLFADNQNNTYLDIGSTLDPFIGLGGTRGYHVGAPTLNKVCTW